MTLRLHWSPDSANLVVRIALERFGLTFEGARVDRAARAQDGPAYRALNPQGLIPVLEDGPLVLFETGAILLHLAERVGRWGPEGPPTAEPGPRAAALAWLFYVSNTVHADLRLGFYAHRYVGDAEQPALLEGVRRRVAGHCALLEDRLAAGPLVAEGPTVVEDYALVCLRWAQIYPRAGRPLLAGLAPWPRLAALAARREHDTALRTACAAEAIPLAAPLTRPERPALPAAEVNG